MKKNKKTESSKGLMKNLTSLKSLTSKLIFGTSEKQTQENIDDINSIRSSINKFASQIKTETGSDITEFFSAGFIFLRNGIASNFFYSRCGTDSR